MYFDMICSCSASFHIELEVDSEEAVWLLVNRFINAHVECGFMTPIAEQSPTEKQQLNIKITPETDTP
jgi:hypothetical protein